MNHLAYATTDEQVMPDARLDAPQEIFRLSQLPLLLTITTLTTVLPVSRQTIARWQAQHVGPKWTRMEGRVVYPREAVLTYLEDIRALDAVTARKIRQRWAA